MARTKNELLLILGEIENNLNFARLSCKKYRAQKRAILQELFALGYLVHNP